MYISRIAAYSVCQNRHTFVFFVSDSKPKSQQQPVSIFVTISICGKTLVRITLDCPFYGAVVCRRSALRREPRIAVASVDFLFHCFLTAL